MVCMKSLKDTINSLCPQLFGKKWAMLYTLIVNWQGIVGPSLAKISRPVNFNLTIRTKSLIIAVNNNCYILELQMRREEIGEHLMRYWGSIAEDMNIKFILSTFIEDNNTFQEKQKILNDQGKPRILGCGPRQTGLYDIKNDGLAGYEDIKNDIITSYMKGIESISDQELRLVMTELAQLCIKDEFKKYGLKPQ